MPFDDTDFKGNGGSRGPALMALDCFVLGVGILSTWLLFAAIVTSAVHGNCFPRRSFTALEDVQDTAIMAATLPFTDVGEYGSFCRVH